MTALLLRTLPFGYVHAVREQRGPRAFRLLCGPIITNNYVRWLGEHRAIHVGVFECPTCHPYINRLVPTLEAHSSVGLVAPQVEESKSPGAGTPSPFLEPKRAVLPAASHGLNGPSLSQETRPVASHFASPLEKPWKSPEGLPSSPRGRAHRASKPTLSPRSRESGYWRRQQRPCEGRTPGKDGNSRS